MADYYKVLHKDCLTTVISEESLTSRLMCHLSVNLRTSKPNVYCVFGMYFKDCCLHRRYLQKD